MSSRWVFIAALALAGCADLERGPAAPPPPDAGVASDGAEAPPADGQTLSFATDVRPLLETCARCHASGQEAGDTQLLFSGDVAADYAALSRFVDASTPASSRLLAKTRGQGHQGGSIYAADSPEYQTILQWIQQGAAP